MVKGVSKRVVVVKSPDPRYFEEAIFIVREGANLAGIGADEVLKEAEEVARQYVTARSSKKEKKRKIPFFAHFTKEE